LNDVDAITQLRRFLHDANPEVDRAAADALAQHGWSAGEGELALTDNSEGQLSLAAATGGELSLKSEND
jgi:hypothetical protein